jgi:4-amino-4-deoxy-L-arabinose transferase-like glycosyltransferase
VLWFLISHLLALVLLAAIAYVAGRLVLRRWIETDGLERFAIASALGLVLLAHLVFALGALGLLARGPLIAVLVGLGALGWWEIELEGRGRLWAGLCLAAAPVFVLSLYPPTGFDETLYHLPYSRAFVRTGSVPFLPELRNPVFPQLDEMLSAGMMLLADDVATHLIRLLMTLLTAALLVAWGRRVFSPGAGWLAAGLFLGSPIIVHLASSGYVEPALNLFAAAALYSLDRWRDGDWRWLALAGAFAASAAGVKYLGLFFVAAVFVTALSTAVRERRMRDLLIAALVCLAVLAPTYGRILAYTGNPLFPFYPGVFGPNPWAPDAVAGRSLEARAVAYVRFPLDVFLDREAVGGQPPYSPFYLMAAPLLVLGLRNPRVRWLAGMSLAYSLVFLLLPPDSRYMTTLLPALSLAVAGSVPWKRALPALALLAFLPGWAYGIYRIEKEGPLPVTATERRLYLARELPAYAALDHLNRLRGSSYTVYGLYTENMVYHADGTLIGDWSGPASYSKVVPTMKDPKAFHRRLQEAGADYLLLVRERGVRLPRGPEWDRLFRRIYSDARADVYELSRIESCHDCRRSRHLEEDRASARHRILFSFGGASPWKRSSSSAPAWSARYCPPTSPEKGTRFISTTASRTPASAAAARAGPST